MQPPVHVGRATKMTTGSAFKPTLIDSTKIAQNGLLFNCTPPALADRIQSPNAS